VKKKHASIKKKTTAKRRASATRVRTRRTSDDILDRIVRAAAAEFRRSGFAGTTTATIARKADVTEAQLFRYFGSKSNLFRETVFKPLDQQLMEFTDRHSFRGVSGEEMRDNTQLYTTALQQFIRENSEVLTSLIVAHTYDRDTAHGVGEINSLRRYFEHAAALMKSRLKSNPRFKPEVLVRVCFASVLACVVFRDWIFPRGLASDDEITAAVNDFVLRGISATYEDPRR
jgi:AcrR family transcriptional regulator